MPPQTDTTTTTATVTPVTLPPISATSTPPAQASPSSTPPTNLPPSQGAASSSASSAPVQMTRAEYQAKYGSPPPVPPAPVKMTTAQYIEKYGQNPDGSPATNDNLTNAKIKETTNPLGKAVVGFGGAAQDTLDALTGNATKVNDNIGTKVLDAVNPVGWFSKLFGAAAGAVGKVASGIASVTTEPAASYLGAKLRDAVGAENVDKVMNAPLTQNLIKEYTTDPDIANGLSAVNSIAALAGTVVGGKGAVEGLGDLSASVKPLAESLKENALGQKVQANPNLPSDTAAKITQATNPQDIAAAQRSLPTVDTDNVKTFDDLSKAIQDKIDQNTKAVDEKLATNKNAYTSDIMTKEIPQAEGQSPLTSNPTAEGLQQLKDFYQKTNAPEDVARISKLQDKFENDGLTAQEINNIAREHGSVLNAYNANGELASGLTKQGAENTRMGMKEQSRGLLPDNEAKAIDANTSDLLNTKNLVDNLGEKVQQLENKIKQTGIIQRMGNILGKAVDFTTGGFLKGMLRTVMGFHNGGSMLNALDLQKALQANLDFLNRLDALTPPQLEEALKNPERLALPSGEGVAEQSPTIHLPPPTEPTPVNLDRRPSVVNYAKPPERLMLPAPQSMVPQVSPIPIRLPGVLGTVGDPFHQAPAGGYVPR